MQNRSHIARLTSTLMMSLLLFLTVFGKELTARQVVTQKAKATQTEKKSADSSKDCSVSELSSAMVVSPVTPHFAQEFHIVPLSFSFETAQKVVTKATKPLFTLEYFEILFEHFIVTNAP
jgi:hypothetical protein